MYIFLKWPEITSCFFKVDEITSKVDRNYLKSGMKLLGPSLPRPILLVFIIIIMKIIIIIIIFIYFVNLIFVT